MKEKLDNFVKVEGIGYEALEEMLRFIYSGRVEKLDHNVIDGIYCPQLKSIKLMI